MRQYISLEEAQDIVLNVTDIMDVENVDILYSQDRILASSVYSGTDLPPFDRSPLDGYAVISDDTSLAANAHPVKLQVIEEIKAGSISRETLRPSHAVKIMTGAPLPPGADAVIRHEDTGFIDDNVLIYSPLVSGSNISRAGEDVKKGELVIKKGMPIHSGVIGMLAALGMEKVETYRKPVVAILSTGDEVVDLGRPLGPGQIYNSNMYALAAAVREYGGEPLLLGSVRDRKEEVAKLITEGIEKADLVLSTGGVSVGDYDVVKEAMVVAGLELLFWRINMKPGTPVACGWGRNKLVLGLSGNPAAALITFHVLVVPVLRRMIGFQKPMLTKVEAIMEDSFAKKSPQRRFLRANVRLEDGRYLIRLTGMQSPGVMKSLLECNALADVPAGNGIIHEGDKLDTLLLRESMHN
ncbi:MAG: molybdopterin molybdotransferase MoeA [Bacillota bacterium]